MFGIWSYHVGHVDRVELAERCAWHTLRVHFFIGVGLQSLRVLHGGPMAAFVHPVAFAIAPCRAYSTCRIGRAVCMAHPAGEVVSRGQALSVRDDERGVSSYGCLSKKRGGSVEKRGVEACSTVRSCGTLDTEWQEKQRTQTVPNEQGHTTSTRPILRANAPPRVCENILAWMYHPDFP